MVGNGSILSGNAERILCAGDLLAGVLPDMSDGNITEWASTLEALKLLDFDTVLPLENPGTNKV